MELPIDVSLTPVDQDGELYVAAFVRDATERRRALNRVNAVNDITKRVAGWRADARDSCARCSERSTAVQLRCRVDRDANFVKFEIVSVDGEGTDVLLGLRLVGRTPVDQRKSCVLVSLTSIEDLSTARQCPPGVGALDLGPGLYVPFVADQRRLGTLVLGRVHGRPSYQPWMWPSPKCSPALPRQPSSSDRFAPR